MNSLKRLAPLLIAVFGFIAFANMLGNSFVWDDEEQIVNNAIIQNFSNFPQIFSGATFSTGGGGLSGWFFRPALTFSYMLIFAIWKLNPFGFHLFQLILHIASAILLFKILQSLSEDSKNKFTPLINTFVSIVFVVHSGLVEAVSYIASLSDVGYTFFILLAFYLLLRKRGSIPSLTNLISVSVSIFLGLLFKESAVVIFPIIFAYLFIYKQKSWKYWTYALGITLLLYLFIRLVLVNVPIRHPEFAPISEAPLSVRLMTIPLTLLSYLRIAFFPDRLAISQHFLVESPSLSSFILPLVTLIAFFGVLTFLAKKIKSRPIFFGLIWFILGFGLISNIFPLDMTTAERWLYFPIIGLFIALAGIISWLSARWPKVLKLLSIVLILAIMGLTVRTIVRNTNWVNGLTLYSHDIKISKNSFDLENNLGVELFRAGQYQEAKGHFENSITLQPKWYFAYNNLGAVYEREKDYKRAKDLYKKTLSLSDYYLAYENLASLLLRENPKEAEKFTQEALKKLPGNPRLWLTLALAEYKLGNKTLAQDAAKKAYLLGPSQEAAYIYSLLLEGKPIDFTSP